MPRGKNLSLRERSRAIERVRAADFESLLSLNAERPHREVPSHLSRRERLGPQPLPEGVVKSSQDPLDRSSAVRDFDGAIGSVGHSKRRIDPQAMVDRGADIGSTNR